MSRAGWFWLTSRPAKLHDYISQQLRRKLSAYFFLLWFSEWEILLLHIRTGLSLPVHVASIRINQFFFQAAGRNCKYFQNLDVWIV